jgi:hypothetical protein
MATNEERYSHLPPDVLAALDKYDSDVSTGAIQFDTEGYAVTFPDHVKPSDDLTSFMASKIPDL